MARKLTFDDLETEIKALIIRPSDLKNVCLVSKQLHEIAVKPLYRNISFDLGGTNDTRLAGLLNPHNKGLKHIRRIRLYLANVRDRCNQKQQANFATRMLLEFLPEDVLEEFRWDDAWCPWEPFSTDNLLLLYKKQRRMKWLEVMDLDREVLPELKKNPKIQRDMFSHARKLALYPENRTSLNLCHFFVEKTTEVLEELIVHTNFDSDDPRGHSPPPGFPASSIDSRELHDSATGPGLLSRTIFSHMVPFEKCTPFKNLRSLHLHKVSLRYSTDTWCKFVDFTNLEHLSIYNCSGADSLFGQLCKSSNLPRQLKVLEIQHKDNAENEALIALDGFLCLVSGIRDLVLDMEHVKTLPAAAGIARHGKTLELLNVHCSQESIHVTTSVGDAEELVWDTEEFQKICNACTGLEQLSCAWPQTSLIRSPSEEWKAFETSALGHLKEMVTLHISTFPTNKPSTQLLPRTVYEQLLQGLAQRIFEMAKNGVPEPVDLTTGDAPAPDPPTDSVAESLTTTKSGRLHLLGFGISDKIYEREDSKNQILFLRSTCLSALGDIKTYAAPIGWVLRQFVEPRSEVLDFVLPRATTVPCRESGGLGSSGRWGGNEDDDGEFDV
ncbi:hypothetical protein LTR36_008513 [Oleoguttula mirabilis]|uniref:F-box domain-containing protein n=1 Tax=Oleoguttula mirabilis TaxID=1507867 RepID=A0AAV9JT86_9PEZI|nr:hypothetical protein LTR36_008513 [Oleoguttula mirabilis]